MKKLLSIKSEEVGADAPILCIRLGEQFCSFAIVDKTDRRLRQLYHYKTEKLTESALDEMLAGHPELKASFRDINICYDFPLSVLAPVNEMGDCTPHSLIELMHGRQGGAAWLDDRLPARQINNYYAAPERVHNWIKNTFPGAHIFHQHSLLLRDADAATGSSVIMADLTHDFFSVVVLKDNQLLLAQDYPYSTPDDVLYYLLRVCARFSLSQETVELQLSGLIERQSALYTELYQYFLHTVFREASWEAPANDYPSHFFTSLNDLSLCVS